MVNISRSEHTGNEMDPRDYPLGLAFELIDRVGQYIDRFSIGIGSSDSIREAHLIVKVPDAVRGRFFRYGLPKDCEGVPVEYFIGEEKINF